MLKVLKEFYNGKIVLITGGSGSIGSELVFQLQKFNPKAIIVLDNSEYGIHKLKRNIKYDSQITKSILIDIKDTIHLKVILNSEKPDIVIHAAAYKHLPILQDHPSEAILTNVMATKNLVSLCQEIGVERFLFVSTDKAVNPTSNLGVSKYLAERIIKGQKDSNTKFYTVRFGNIYGSSGSVVEVFEEQIKLNNVITITDKKASRYFISIEEASNLLLVTLTLDANNGIFIFKMGKPKKIVEVANEIALRNKLELFKNVSVSSIGLSDGEKLEEILCRKDDSVKQTKNPKIIKVIENFNDFIDLSRLDELIDLAKDRKDRLISFEISRIIKKINK